MIEAMPVLLIITPCKFQKKIAKQIFMKFTKYPFKIRVKMSATNIVQQIFEDIGKKVPRPQETKLQLSMKQGLFSDQNKISNTPTSFKAPKPLPNTPSRQKVKLIPPNTTKTPTRVPKTPQPTRISKNSSKTSAAATPSTPKASANKDPETDVKVFLRIRPIIGEEEHADFDINENVVCARPTMKDESASRYAQRKFTFSHIFNEESYQDEVFQGVAWPMLRHFIRGHDGLLFSYGATSAGKTFTVRGTEENPGLIPRIIKTILGMNNPSGFERGIFISCVEIYNERIHDLLGESKIPLRIGKDSFGYTVVKNAKEIEMNDPSQLKEILETIDKQKAVSATTMNASSSRSHCVFTIKMITIPLDPRTGKRSEDISKMCSSKLSIVDLAGSERVDPMEKSNIMVSEACNINKSMLVLGRCIREIRKIKNGAKGVQVPYRESKITELFRDFFDPISTKKTFCSIIVNISPSTVQFEDTLFALQFAAEAIECEVKNKDDDFEEEEEDEDFAVRKLNFDDDDDADDSARTKKEFYEACNSKVEKISQIASSIVEQAKEEDKSSSLPAKLSNLITSKIRDEASKRELDEIQRDIDRLKVVIQEKDAHLSSITDKMKQMAMTLKAVVQDTAEKEEQKKNLEERAQRILNAAKKEQQEIIELQRTHQKTMMNLKADHENKLFALEAKKYQPPTEQ